jgi:hypothetical protein
MLHIRKACDFYCTPEKTVIQNIRSALVKLGRKFSRKLNSRNVDNSLGVLHPTKTSNGCPEKKSSVIHGRNEHQMAGIRAGIIISNRRRDAIRLDL